MKNIYESVAFGIVAVYELGDMIREERNEGKREALMAIRFAYYYLIDNMNKQFGCTHFEILNALVKSGYEYHHALNILASYEAWASHVVKLDEMGDGT